VLLSGSGHARGVVIKGCDPELELRTDDALRRIVSGAADFTPDADGSIRSSWAKSWPRSLNIQAGEYVTLTSPEGAHSIRNGARSRRFRVTGIFDSGFYDYDANWRLQRWPRRRISAGVGDVVSVPGIPRAGC